jgi:hypothetical protein
MCAPEKLVANFLKLQSKHGAAAPLQLSSCQTLLMVLNKAFSNTRLLRALLVGVVEYFINQRSACHTASQVFPFIFRSAKVI